jgi:hypothetical protein
MVFWYIEEGVGNFNSYSYISTGGSYGFKVRFKEDHIILDTLYNSHAVRCGSKNSRERKGGCPDHRLGYASGLQL